MKFLLQVNGAVRKLDVDPEKPLLWALREDLGLPGTKFGCGAGLCGACTVHIDGVAARSCQISVGDAASATITTIESIARDEIGRRTVDAWIALDVPQCGYCQAGQIMAATALLRDTPDPDDADIDGAMLGNLCRCGTYPRIRAAIKLAAKGVSNG
jgi:isoquinoline 1-oxidoreductase alpha subunit